MQHFLEAYIASQEIEDPFFSRYNQVCIITPCIRVDGFVSILHLITMRSILQWVVCVCVCVCVVALCGNALLSSHTHALMHDAAGDCGSRDGYPFPTDGSVRDVATARALAP